MLNKLLPQNSPIRHKLRVFAQKLNMAVSPRIRKNFSQPSSNGIRQLRELLHQSYFPSWYSGVDMDAFYESQEAQMAFDNHLTHRLEMDRSQPGYSTETFRGR